MLYADFFGFLRMYISNFGPYINDNDWGTCKSHNSGSEEHSALFPGLAGTLSYTPGTRDGPGSRYLTLALKSRKIHPQKATTFKTSWVCRATLDFNYGLGWVGVGLGLGLGWGRVGVGLDCIGVELPISESSELDFELKFQTSAMVGVGWVGWGYYPDNNATPSA